MSSGESVLSGGVSMSIISYENTKDVTYDPHSALYWDRDSLDREITRTFEICHGCRMCFKYCTAFPSLFTAIDTSADGDVRKISPEDKKKIIGECYQCKICYVKCPYTDRDNHLYNLNYPALMQRAVHIDAKENGVDLRDKILQNADLAGKMTTGLISGVANKILNTNFHRAIAQAIIGIHKDKLLPAFHKSTFMQRFRKRKKTEMPAPAAKVVLFSTCFVNYNNPDLGEDAVSVLEKNNVQVVCPEQNCCGMPGLNTGDLPWAEKKMKANVESLYPYAKDGFKILAINPTCSLTLKKEYVTFLPPGEWREKAAVVAAASMDLNEFLFELKKEGKFNRAFRSTPGEVSYHVPCHLRAQNIGFRSRDMMRLIPESEIHLVEECCGHNGTWAMKEEYFDLSMIAGKRSFEGMKEHPDSQFTTDCPLAAIQLEQGTGSKFRPVHPMQILAKAYLSPEEGGFESPVKSEESR